MARISGYNKFCNDDGKGNFNTHATASGIPISNQHYTLAVPMKNTSYNVGDVILVKNRANGKSAIFLATDVGGLPNADVDIVEGEGLKALGVTVTAGGEANGKGVAAISQKNDFDIQRIGEIDIKDKESVRKFQELSHQVNQGQKPLSALKTEVPKFSTGLDQKQLGQNLDSYATKGMTPDSFPKRGDGPDEGYRDRRPGEKYRDEDEYIGYLKKLMETKPLLALFLMVMAIVSGQYSPEQMSELFNIVTGDERAAPFIKQNRESFNNGGPGTQKVFKQADPGTPGGIWGEAWNNTLTPDLEAKLKALVPDAVAQAEKLKAAGKDAYVYQEVKGSGSVSYGVSVFTDRSGNIRAIPSSTGGVGNGSFPGASTGTGAGMIDPRYPDAKEIPNYKLTNFRSAEQRANQGLANLGAFTFDMTSNGQDFVAGTGRDALRTHVGTNNSPRSLGCQHISAHHAQFFINEFRGRDVEMQTLVTTDKGNVLYQELAKIRPEQIHAAAPAQAQPEAAPAAPPKPEAAPAPAPKAETPAAPKAEEVPKAESATETKPQASAISEDVRAQALAAVSGISKENQVTDKAVTSDKRDAAETLAQHKATVAAVSKDKQATPPAAKAATEAAKTTGPVLA